MQNPAVNRLTIPVALIIVAMAMVISSLIFVLIGNTETEGQAPELANNSIAMEGSSLDNNSQFNRLQRQNFGRHARPNLGKLRAFMAEKKARSNPQIFGKGKLRPDGDKP
jgi:hypothetical protein